MSDGFIQAVNDGARGYTHIRNNRVTNPTDFVFKVQAWFLGDASRAGNRTIGVCWWPGDLFGESVFLTEAGRFEGATCHGPDDSCPAHTAGQIVPVPVGTVVALTVVHDRGRSAVYIDDVPRVHHVLPSIRELGGGFSLCPATHDGLQSDIAYDNLKVWDLDRLGVHAP